MHDVGLDDRTLRRTIAMLVALAVLAERAATRCFPVRWFVLAILRYAETVAMTFVVEATGWNRFDIDDAFGAATAHEAGVDTVNGAGSGPADALTLAWRLRALAALLGALLPPDAFFGHSATRAGADPGDRATHAARFLAMLGVCHPHPAPDTS